MDLGCCVAATGGWVLSNGASRYVGVEMDPDLVIFAKQNLDKYHQGKNYTVICSAVEDYVEKCDEKFDIILLAGIVYYVKDSYRFLLKITEMSDQIIIDSRHPRMSKKDSLDNLLKQLSNIKPLQKELIVAMHRLFVEIEYVHPFTEYNIKDSRYISLMSLGGYAFLMDTLGYAADTSAYETLKSTLPQYYNKRRRFLVRFKKR